MDAIGNTPLVKLKRLTAGLECRVLAKLEYFNPSGSIKDRMARFMIEDAERRGLLRPGGTIVESTSGNTGAALAMLAALKGYRAIFTIPDTASKEKIDALRAFGAEVLITPSDIPPTHPRSCYEVAKHIARETPNSYYPDQYENQANALAHYHTTGPEIWGQVGGEIDYLIAGIGTGGTLSGAAKYLKERKPSIKAIAVDPKGSVYYDYFKRGKLSEPRTHHTEGIGRDKLCSALRWEYVDDVVQVSDRRAFEMARRLAREEGIFAGGSSGAAVHAALKVAKKARRPGTVVVILPDGGAKYLSKLYNDDWMRSKGFL